MSLRIDVQADGREKVCSNTRQAQRGSEQDPVTEVIRIAKRAEPLGTELIAQLGIQGGSINDSRIDHRITNEDITARGAVDRDSGRNDIEPEVVSLMIRIDLVQRETADIPELEPAVRHDAGAVAQIPFIVVLGLAQTLAEVVAIGIREEGCCHVELHPIDDPSPSLGTTFGLQSLRDREPQSLHRGLNISRARDGRDSSAQSEKPGVVLRR